MRTFGFETLMRRATTLSRRASLLTFGAAVLAAATPGVTKAGKSGQSCGKKQQKRCNENKTQCVSKVAVLCNGTPECVAALTPCCDECFSSGFVSCHLDTIINP